MFKLWYALLFVLAVAALSGTFHAGSRFLEEPGIVTGGLLAAWVLFLAADGFLLLLQDYRLARARGKVKTPVGVFERFLALTARRPTDRKETSL